MGAYKYIGELYKKKQSDVLRFLLRVRCVLLGLSMYGTLAYMMFGQMLGIPPIERHPPCLTTLTT
jgi:hypothetical protein